MGRLAGVGVKAVEFGSLDGFGQTPDGGLKFGEGFALFDHDGIEFLVQAFEVREISFHACQAILKRLVHGWTR